ncbi:MAG: hypothetical protein IJ199_09420 [Prevotella sp.]|nr:hypothetical protein [Prevotella sp.]
MTSLLLLLLPIALADTTTTDSQQKLDEVVITSNAKGGRRSAKGRAATIDEHLSELSSVNLIRRGSYAWEPVVNNMQTERVSTTIDGMKIFYACTDKMDPVTSYVESSNLKSILLNSGLNGNPQSTGGIGGSLDLKLNKAGFHASAPLYSIGATAGYETNGNVQAYSVTGSASARAFYTNGGFSYRHAGCYKEGGGRKVDFSQFQKINIFDNFGIRLARYDVLEGTVIYDRATDVGYPALNMDVSLAEAIITSLAYRHTYTGEHLRTWENKVYYNHIKHVMDDTHRPDVEIHMDMPGRSKTAGLYSLLTGQSERHQWQANIDLYYNRLFADMTMYPGGAAPMYMVTWADVGTLNTGVAFGDEVRLNATGARVRHSLNGSVKLSQQWQKINDKEGLNALSVFFPGMKDNYQQTTGRIALNYAINAKDYEVVIGAGWGSRAPTVTEAYGYYLNNTFDQYDYIGNPRLKNESATELSAKLRWMPSGRFNLSFDANAFLFSNYIIGQFEPRLSAMTVAAEGVKVYGNLSSASVLNASLTSQWHPLRALTAETTLSIARGTDNVGDPLPLIAPFSYSLRLLYTNSLFLLRGVLRGHARQTNYGAKYGETQTPAWTVVDITAETDLKWLTGKSIDSTLRLGVENLFDHRYTTYSDWCGIPQKGRNFFISLTLDY